MEILDNVKASLSWKIFRQTKKSKEKENWAQIEQYLIEKIPFFRFLKKLLHSYPNADRNLNI